MPIPIPVILGAAGLGAYLLFRKKPAADAVLTEQTRAALAAPSFAPVAPSFTPPPAGMQNVSPARSAEDAKIVEEAIAQFATERGASFDADPLVEQAMDRFDRPVTDLGEIDDFSAVEDRFVDFEEEEEDSTLASVVSFFNPFGDEETGEDIQDQGFESEEVEEEEEDDDGFFGF